MWSWTTYTSSFDGVKSEVFVKYEVEEIVGLYDCWVGRTADRM